MCIRLTWGRSSFVKLLLSLIIGFGAVLGLGLLDFLSSSRIKYNSDTNGANESTLKKNI